MKTYWSAFLSLLFFTMLTGCGNEQFGTGGQSSNDSVPSVSAFSAQSCSNYTLIKPKVDVLYVVDNSASSYYVASDVKVALQRTVDGLSRDFDYRVIGTPLIETPSSNNDYQVMTNSTDLMGLPSDGRRIQTSGQFTFFSNAAGGAYEIGLNRVYNFVNFHKNGLLRSNAYTLIVLVSNGRDVQVEPSQAQYGNGAIGYSASAFNTALSNMLSVKNSLQAQQLRMISVTAQSACQSGWTPSTQSYVQMSRKLYENSGATDQSSATPDAYDLCTNSVSNIFSSVNNAIKQVVIAHGYRFWPITFAENNVTVSTDDIKVTKVTSTGSKINLVRDVDWTYQDNVTPMSINTRETPTPGEPITGRHFVRFTNLLNYPDCVLVTSVSKTEVFNYVVLPKKPLLPVTVKVNGAVIPQTALSTATVASSTTVNIKFSPTNTPPVMRTGFMIQITDPNYYYKSGDNVETLYTPAGI